MLHLAERWRHAYETTLPQSSKIQEAQTCMSVDRASSWPGSSAVGLDHSWITAQQMWVGITQPPRLDGPQQAKEDGVHASPHPAAHAAWLQLQHGATRCLAAYAEALTCIWVQRQAPFQTRPVAAAAAAAAAAGVAAAALLCLPCLLLRRRLLSVLLQEASYHLSVRAVPSPDVPARKGGARCTGGSRGQAAAVQLYTHENGLRLEEWSPGLAPIQQPLRSSRGGAPCQGDAHGNEGATVCTKPQTPAATHTPAPHARDVGTHAIDVGLRNGLEDFGDARHVLLQQRKASGHGRHCRMTAHCGVSTGARAWGSALAGCNRTWFGCGAWAPSQWGTVRAAE